MSSMPSRAGLTTAPPPDAALAAVLSGQPLSPALARGFARPTQAHTGGAIMQELAVAGLEPGLYIVTLELDGQRITQKLILR